MALQRQRLNPCGECLVIDNPLSRIDNHSHSRSQ